MLEMSQGGNAPPIFVTLRCSCRSSPHALCLWPCVAAVAAGKSQFKATALGDVACTCTRVHGQLEGSVDAPAATHPHHSVMPLLCACMRAGQLQRSGGPAPTNEHAGWSKGGGGSRSLVCARVCACMCMHHVRMSMQAGAKVGRQPRSCVCACMCMHHVRMSMQAGAKVGRQPRSCVCVRVCECTMFA